jgi:peptide methionine sulfoxide reductase MsrB
VYVFLFLTVIHLRHYAEHSGYFEGKTQFVSDAKDSTGPIEFYDSNSGKLLFTAPIGRTMDDFLIESKAHGWPSFRDVEVNWDYVRVLPDGETVSVDGTHLGHNLPDRKGNRFCINLVSVAGYKK